MTPEQFEELVDTKTNMMRASGEVVRWHTTQCIKPQTDASHQWNVVRIILHVMGWGASKPLLVAAQIHDMGELGMGDSPRPAKHVSGTSEVLRQAEVRVADMMFDLSDELLKPSLIRLDPFESLMLEWADLVEALEYALNEVSLGNAKMTRPLEKYMPTLLAMTVDIALVHNMDKIYERAANYIERNLYKRGNPDGPTGSLLEVLNKTVEKQRNDRDKDRLGADQGDGST